MDNLHITNVQKHFSVLFISDMLLHMLLRPSPPWTFLFPWRCILSANFSARSFSVSLARSFSRLAHSVDSPPFTVSSFPRQSHLLPWFLLLSVNWWFSMFICLSPPQASPVTPPKKHISIQLSITFLHLDISRYFKLNTSRESHVSPPPPPQTSCFSWNPYLGWWYHLLPIKTPGYGSLIHF